MEEVKLNELHFLHLFSKGSLFSLGLTAVSTGADPGFRGHLGITMTNLSSRPIRFQVGMGFVKGIFYELAEAATVTYTGQHGDAHMSWPYPSQFHLEPENFDQWDAAHWQSILPPLRAAMKRQQLANKYLRWISAAFATLVLINIASWMLDELVSVGFYEAIERYLNLVAAFLQIGGFVLSIALFAQHR
jgi:dCTP deaminase